MKALINWIIFIPVLILAVGVELFTAFNPVGAESFFGMDANGISEVILIAIVALFAVFFILSLFDRKTSPVHVLRHNYAAGICGVIAAFALAGDTAAGITDIVQAQSLGVLDVVQLLVSAVAAVSLLIVGINHFTATNTKNNTAAVYLSIPLWCAVHLLTRFMTHTATPVAMAETMDLVMYVFLAIFFMYAMMVISLINGKNPVKGAIFWGAPAAVASLVYAASVVGNVSNTEGASAFEYLDAVVCGFIGLYIISFIAELSFMSKTKEEQYVLETSEAEDEDEADLEEQDADSVVPVVVNDDEVQVADNGTDNYEESAVEAEINQSMKKYFEDIASVESELEPEEDCSEGITAEDDTAVTFDKEHDYGNYFESEELDDMYIEDENLAVDTTRKRSTDKSKYPVTNKKTVFEPAMRDDDCVVGIEEVGTENDSYVGAGDDASDYVLNATKPETQEQVDAASDNYEARLDEIDRLIISIQGGDRDK